jgi:integrase
MVEENIIAQLMGHANKGMTFGRYAKGYVASNLKNSIETLHYPS